MSEPDFIYWPSRETIVFIGIALQAIAIVWIWRDWTMSQYHHADWRKAHRQSESETLSSLSALWAKFGGPSTAETTSWDSISSLELERMSKGFPAFLDDEALKKRKIDLLTPLYGIGPSDAELVKIRNELEYLALLRRGVADYRTFIRRKTFRTALGLMLIGLVLQLAGSWPSRWIVTVEHPADASDSIKQNR